MPNAAFCPNELAIANELAIVAAALVWPVPLLGAAQQTGAALHVGENREKTSLVSRLHTAAAVTMLGQILGRAVYTLLLWRSGQNTDFFSIYVSLSIDCIRLPAECLMEITTLL